MVLMVVVVRKAATGNFMALLQPSAQVQILQAVSRRRRGALPRLRIEVLNRYSHQYTILGQTVQAPSAEMAAWSFLAQLILDKISKHNRTKDAVQLNIESETTSCDVDAVRFNFRIVRGTGNTGNLKQVCTLRDIIRAAMLSRQPMWKSQTEVDFWITNMKKVFQRDSGFSLELIVQ